MYPCTFLNPSGFFQRDFFFCKEYKMNCRIVKQYEISEGHIILLIGGDFVLLCFGCFEENEQDICPLCGYHNKMILSSLLLPHGTVLRGQYIVGKVLGKSGGFGTTYLAYHQTLQIKVAIKEYLPSELVCRDSDGLTIHVNHPQDADNFRNGINQFLNEARLLVKFNHPNIVRGIDFFEENGTAYLVMDYYQGVNLAEYMEQQGGILSEQAVMNLIMPILGGLQELHTRGVLHRDIKPQNIYVTHDGRPILLDFGAAKQILGEHSRSLALMATPGFAAYEQYHIQGKQGPWTDIYSCTATIYYMLSKMVPTDAIERMAQDTFYFPLELENKISPEMRNAIVKGMAILPENRVQSVQEFQQLLLNQTVKLQRNLENTQKIPKTAVPLSALNDSMNFPENTNREAKPFYKNTLGMIAALLIMMSAVASGGYWYYQQSINPTNQLAKRGISFTDEAFFTAIKTNDIDAAKLFFAGGMSPNHIKKDTGETAIMIAIGAGQLEMVNFLITSGADLNAYDSQGQSLIDLALQQGNTAILKIIMNQSGIGPNTKDDKGQTLLGKAIAINNVANIKFLIEQGADINARNEEGKTPLDRVLASGNQQMVSILKNAGAKRNINSGTKTNLLNKVAIRYGTTADFEVDLLGDGIGQQCTIKSASFFSHTTATFSREGSQLTSFNILGSGHREWYLVYLRDDNTPDLVYFNTEDNGSSINDFKIVGRTGENTIGVLYDFRENSKKLSKEAKLSINGKQLIVQTRKEKLVIEWNGTRFRDSLY